ESANHAVGVWSRDRTVRMTWSGATDDRSGVYGYSARWDTSASTLPVAAVNVEGTAIPSPSPKDGMNPHFHLRARDRATNWPATAVHLGPFFIDGTPPVNGTLTATPGLRQIALSWSGFTDALSGLAPADTYVLVFRTATAPAPRCTTGSRLYVGNGQSFQHQGLTGAMTYYYRVCAVDRAGSVSTGATGMATAE